MGPHVARTKANPGNVSYGSSGPGAAIHLAVAWFGVTAGGLEFNHIHYKGAAPAIQDLLAGTTDFSAAPLSLVAPFIKDGKLRAIATTGASRIKTLPDVPTMTELGYRDSVVQFMMALVAPAKLPPEIARKIAQDAAAVMRDPEVTAKAVDPFGFNVAVDTPEEFARYLAGNVERTRARVRAANVVLD